MTTLTAVFAPALTASNVTDRQITGLLLPFNEIGYTNMGPVTVPAGAVDISDPAIILNLEHDRRILLGRATALEETEQGIQATFHIAATRAGDDALEEIKAGLRTCLSVEIDDIDIEMDTGKIKAGRVTGAGLVLTPAFESARLAASKTEDQLEPDEEPDEETESTDNTEPDTGETDKEEKEETDMTDARVNEMVNPGLTAGKEHTSLDQLIAGFTAAQSSTQLKAALSDIIPSAWSGYEQPDYVGELWNGKSFQRRVLPRFAHKDLVSRTIKGWRWVTKPEVGPYEGDKTAIPSNEISTEPVEINATRIAGGHDIDRVFVDFDSPEFWTAYFAAMTESYARLSDATVLTAVKTGATQVEMGAVPADVAPGLVAVVDGVLSVLNETDSLPDTAFVAPDLWRALMLTKHDDRLAYLDAALGFEEGTLAERRFAIIPESRLDIGSVLVTARDAVTVHEFGGGTPIRVQALDIANGGVDAAVFGYMAVNIHDKGGLALVTAGEPAA